MKKHLLKSKLVENTVLFYLMKTLTYSYVVKGVEN